MHIVFCQLKSAVDNWECFGARIVPTASNESSLKWTHFVILTYPNEEILRLGR